MGLQDTSDNLPDRRQHVILILTVLGAFDFALGAAIAAFGPGFIGDPSLDTVIRICGAVFALAGLGMLLFARTRRKAADTSSDSSAVQRNS